MADPTFVFLVIVMDVQGEGTAILACHDEKLAIEIGNKIGTARVERVPLLDPVAE